MDVAIVCWEFEDAQRSRSMAEVLAAHGHRVTFFTSEPGARSDSYAVVSIPFTRPARRVRAAIGIPGDVDMARAARSRGAAPARVVSFAARTFEELTQFPDKYRAWIPAVRAWLREHPGALAGTGVVIASSPPASALWVGRMFAASCGASLVFDFRDLWTDNPSYPYRGLRRAIDRASERRAMTWPAAAITATESLARSLSERYPTVPVTAVYTAIDPAPWLGHAPRRPDGRLVFAHFGVWYPGRRSIRPLLESLRRLADAGEVDLAHVSVDLWGNGADDETWRSVAELGMRDVVRDRGKLAPADVPAALASVDVALLLAWPEDTISVPLKTHGYLASGRPILALRVGRGSEMVRVLEGAQGVTIGWDDGAIDDAVRGYWAATQRGETMSWPPEQRGTPVSRARMAEQLLAVLTTARQRS